MKRPFSGHASTFDSSSSSSLSSSPSITPPMPPSRASTAFSAMSTVTSSTSASYKSHCYDAYLMPDTFELPVPPEPSSTTTTSTNTNKTVPSATEPPTRKCSAWETYLLETSQHRSELAVDRKAMRAELLASMKTHYGNCRWECVPAFGDERVEYVADEPQYQDYTDQIILYGEQRNVFRRRYVDRRGFTVPTKEFEIVRLDAEGHARPGLVRRITNRMKR